MLLCCVVQHCWSILLSLPWPLRWNLHLLVSVDFHRLAGWYPPFQEGYCEPGAGIPHPLCLKPHPRQFWSFPFIQEGLYKDSSFAVLSATPWGARSWKATISIMLLGYWSRWIIPQLDCQKDQCHHFFFSYGTGNIIYKVLSESSIEGEIISL